MKATQEFIERESEQLLFVVVSGVAPAKGDLAIGKRDQAVVANSHTMGVAAEIAAARIARPACRSVAGRAKQLVFGKAFHVT